MAGPEIKSKTGLCMDQCSRSQDWKGGCLFLNWFCSLTVYCGSLSCWILINQSFFCLPSTGNLWQCILFVFIVTLGTKIMKWYTAAFLQQELFIGVQICCHFVFYNIDIQPNLAFGLSYLGHCNPLPCISFWFISWCGWFAAHSKKTANEVELFDGEMGHWANFWCLVLLPA